MAEMTNADLFQREFGIYATELWAMPEDKFLEWLNAPCDTERPKDMLSPSLYEMINEAHNEGFDVGYWAGRRDYEQKWIPVTERLPDDVKREYWICTDTGYQCECRWTNNRFGIGELGEWGWSIFDVPQYQKVVAWMPLLPEPYTQGGNENE